LRELIPDDAQLWIGFVLELLSEGLYEVCVHILADELTKSRDLFQSQPVAGQLAQVCHRLQQRGLGLRRRNWASVSGVGKKYHLRRHGFEDS
jgi:hypothetical protein